MHSPLKNDGQQPGLFFYIEANDTPSTVKLVRSKIHAITAAKVLSRWNALQMKARFPSSKDCLRFPQVTGGKLVAPAGKLREAYILHTRAEKYN